VTQARRPLGGVSVRLRALARRAAYALLDVHAWVAGPSASPPRWLPLVGSGDFESIGRRYLGYFIEIGGLRPTAHVLDIGCGLGRMATPLTTYLEPSKGRYVGFDVDARAVRWCRRRIGRRHANFEFHVADVRNVAYHRGGALDGATYPFPYEDATFDFAIATSVFTHLVPEAARNYLREIGRVLRPEGRAFLTFFLLNAESIAGLDRGRSRFDFAHDVGTHRVLDPAVPEAAVALPEDDVLTWLREAGLDVEPPIRYGGWSGRRKMLTGQDVVVAVRTIDEGT